MKWSTFTVTVATGGVLLIVGQRIFAPERPTPAAVLEGIRERATEPLFAERRALRELERAFDEARGIGDDETAGEILLFHAEILLELGAYGDAREDLVRVLAELRPGDPEIELRLASTRALEGQVPAALEGVDAILARLPEDWDAWRLKGELEARLGQAELDHALEVTRQSLVRSEAEGAVQLLAGAARRDVGDAERAGLVQRFREQFPSRLEVELEQALDGVDRASRHFATARGAYARSFRGRVEPEALSAFLDLLAETGNRDLAADVGLAALAQKEASASPQVLREVVDDLEQLGRTASARRVLSAWSWRDTIADLPFYERACRALYSLEEWRLLTAAAISLVRLGNDRQTSYGVFYLGVSSAHLTEGQDKAARLGAAERLQRYLRPEKIYEPVPDAIGLAWYHLARIYREADPARERQALEAALMKLPTLSGEAWLRLVELQLDARNSGFRVPEERWTRAMALLPERAYELMPQWEDLGQRSLTADGWKFESISQQVQARGDVLPAMDVGPYTLYRLAREHLARGRRGAAQDVADVLLEEYPGLLPALDVLIEARLAYGHENLAAAALIERLSLVGRDVRTSAYLEALGEDVFTPEQRLTMVRRDARGTGRILVARHLLERGEPSRALAALRGDGEDRLEGEARLLAARASRALGRGSGAMLLLRGLLEDPTFGERAKAALVEVLLAEDSSGLEEIIGDLVTGERVDRELLLSTAMRLQQRGAAPLAQRLLERLDAGADLRSGEVLLGLVAVLELQHQRGPALEALARAEAFLDDGRAELLRIVFAIEDHDWPSLPLLAEELRATRFRPTPLQQAILALVSERLEAGATSAADGLEDSPGSAAWALTLAAAQTLTHQSVELPEDFGEGASEEAQALLRGAEDHARDPREILRLLLAMDLPGWEPWVLQRILRLEAAQDEGRWLAWLRGRTLAAMGTTEHAERVLERLVEDVPDFTPGWDELGALLRARSSDEEDSPEVIDLAALRLAALGDDASGSATENAAVRAAKLAKEGEVQVAVRVLTAAHADHPETTDGRALLGRLFAGQERWSDASREYARACDALPAGSSHPLVAEFLDVLNAGSRAQSEQGIGPDVLRIALTRLEERFPEDPLVALAQSVRLLNEDSAHPELGAGRAMAALDLFRQRTGRRSLEVLRPGSTVAWTDFLATIAPQAAHALVEKELELAPGDPDLWLAAARVAEARRQPLEAVELYETVAAISSDARAHEALARILARRGSDPQTIRDHLAAAGHASTGRPTPLALFAIAVASVEEGTNAKVLVTAMSELLGRRRASLGDVRTFDFALVYVRALFQSGTARDIAQALAALERITEEARDGYERDALIALEGIASTLEPVQEVPKRERAER